MKYYFKVCRKRKQNFLYLVNCNHLVTYKYNKEKVSSLTIPICFPLQYLSDK